MRRALLPQTGRATLYVSRNVADCCTTVETSCTTNSQQIEVMELEHYGHYGRASATATTRRPS